jgi:predicted restriction endonuclease
MSAARTKLHEEAAAVLREANEPLHVNEIWRRIARRGRYRSRARNPEASLATPKFRRALLRAYQGTCAVSGSAVEQLLEAAHIRPYRGAHTNHVQNGLPLRADLHTLLDRFLLTIEPSTRRVVLSSELAKSEYAQWSGRQIFEPRSLRERPLAEVLEYHFNEFQRVEQRRLHPESAI